MILIACSSMFLFGCVGLYQSTLGLELSDVLPEGTAPSAFLRAREEYFSFYPMFAVLKGPNIDYPNEQEVIEQYRLDIGESFLLLAHAKDVFLSDVFLCAHSFLPFHYAIILLFLAFLIIAVVIYRCCSCLQFFL